MSLVQPKFKPGDIIIVFPLYKAENFYLIEKIEKDFVIARAYQINGCKYLKTKQIDYTLFQYFLTPPEEILNLWKSQIL